MALPALLLGSAAIPAARAALPRIGSFFAGSASRGAAAGAAGGVLLDDIPGLRALDPTEGGGSSLTTGMLVGGAVVVGLVGLLILSEDD